MKEQLPLQLIYIMDQFYVNYEYLSGDKNKKSILKNIEGEIKIVCRSIFNEINEDRLLYCRLLCTQLL